MKDPLLGHVVDAALALLGAELIRSDEGLSARIVEVEAYRASTDPGSHAYRGPTPRNRTMFGPPGRAYVYFTYGMHWMLNVSAEPEGSAGAVLIRAAEPVSGLEIMQARRPKAHSPRELLRGPAMLASAFGLDRSWDGMDLRGATSTLHIRLRQPGLGLDEILFGPRIGIAKGRGDETPWRFVWSAGLGWSSGRVGSLRQLMDLAPIRAMG